MLRLGSIRFFGTLRNSAAEMPESVTVTIRQGALRGRRCKTPSGSPFLSFQGIPYAQPPVGALRFKEPQPLEPCFGIRDATKEGNHCMQFDPLTKQFGGVEDCLFLNVFTPNVPTGLRDDKPRAVLVWIHGGGFLNGSSNMYGPTPLMDQDVVLVTINYRVGPLGFLSLNNAEIPGNAGLKDQTMALRWVRDNISTFGGDPQNVTIFGESAGGASVHYHVLSPLSKGLFHRAIAQSGSAYCPWALSRDPVARAKRLAQAAGCEASLLDDPDALVAWLRQVPAVNLVKAHDAAMTVEERRRGVLSSMVPCVEPSHPGAFLPEEPATLIADGAVSRVPLIFGVTSHEGILMLPGSLIRFGIGRKVPADVLASPEAMEVEEAKMLAEIAGDMERLLPEDLLAKKGDPQQMCERIKKFYFGGKELSEETLEGFVHLNTDLYFSGGTIRAAREHERLGSPVFMYEFAFHGALNFLGILLQSKVNGVCHGDELAYQFNLPILPEPEEGSREAITRQRLGRLWTNFAKSGNPTPVQDEVITKAWLPFSESDPNYLRIGDELEIDKDLMKDRMQFWDELHSK